MTEIQIWYKCQVLSVSHSVNEGGGSWSSRVDFFCSKEHKFIKVFFKPVSLSEPVIWARIKTKLHRLRPEKNALIRQWLLLNTILGGGNPVHPFSHKYITIYHKCQIMKNQLHGPRPRSLSFDFPPNVLNAGHLDRRPSFFSPPRSHCRRRGVWTRLPVSCATKIIIMKRTILCTLRFRTTPPLHRSGHTSHD